MNHITILGIGSPFGDDKVGWEVIERLSQNTELAKRIPAYLRLEHCTHPGLDLLEFLQDANRVILIDAVRTGAALGTCHQFSLNEIEPLYRSLSTHGIGVGYALKLACTLQLLPENITLYGIEIGDISYTEGLSQPVQQAVIQLGDVLAAEMLLTLPQPS